MAKEDKASKDTEAVPPAKVDTVKPKQKKESDRPSEGANDKEAKKAEKQPEKQKDDPKKPVKPNGAHAEAGKADANGQKTKPEADTTKSKPKPSEPGQPKALDTTEKASGKKSSGDKIPSEKEKRPATERQAGTPVPTIQISGHEAKKAEVGKTKDSAKATKPKPERKMSYAKVAQSQAELIDPGPFIPPPLAAAKTKHVQFNPSANTSVSSLDNKVYGFGTVLQFRNPFDSRLPLIRMSGAECDAFCAQFAQARLDGSKTDYESHREDLCRAVAILAKRRARQQVLFNYAGARGTRYDKAKVYKLEGDESVKAPLQCLHISQLTITHDMSNKKYTDVKLLLNELNVVQGTDYSLSRPGLRACLQGYLDESCDFGQIYGYLRPWWFRGNFDRITALMQKRKEEDAMLRRNAVDGDAIVNPNVPPRRVWDLFSNRVLPFYVLPVTSPSIIPDNVWSVSHSWKEEKLRTRYRTRINGEAWYVPLPKDTEAHNLRIELLNLGAEYVFLDVLCLRQYDHAKPGQEYRRKKEWRVDVPTIGYVYQPPRTTVVYFNGLGDAFSMRPEGGLLSKFHWFRRVWTLQEAVQNWLPGGLTDASLHGANLESASMDFSNRLLELVNITEHRNEPDMFQVLAANCAREYSNPVDSVAALAYLLGCESLPIYNADLDVEGAWEALIETMTPLQRLTLLIRWGGAGDSEGLYAWRPSWKQLMKHDFRNFVDSPTKLFPALFESEQMEDELLEYMPNAGYQDSSDAYFHYAYVVQSCAIRSNTKPVPRSPAKTQPPSATGSDSEDENDTPDDNILDPWVLRAATPELSSHGTVTVHSGKKEYVFQVATFGCPIQSCKGEFVMVGVANFRYWIVGRKKGSRRVGAGRGGALVLSKVAVLTLSDTNASTPQSMNLGQVDMVVYC